MQLYARLVNRAFLPAALALLATGCFKHWVDFEVQRVSAMHVRAIDASGFDVTVRATIFNPNRLGATIRNVRFEARAGSHIVGRGVLAGPITVGARTGFEVDAPVRIAYADLPADLPDRVQAGFLPLTIRARVDAATSVGSFHMDLEDSSRVEIARALDVAVSGTFSGDALVVRRIAMISVDTESIVLRVVVDMRNAFAFPVRIRRGDVTLWVNDRRFGNAKLEQAIELLPGQPVTHTFDIAATHEDVLRTVKAMLDSEPVFRAQGTVWIEPIAHVSRIPFDVTADMSVFDPEEYMGPAD